MELTVTIAILTSKMMENATVMTRLLQIFTSPGSIVLQMRQCSDTGKQNPVLQNRSGNDILIVYDYT